MQAVLDRCGIQTKGQKTICPFHKDTHPSMQVYKDGFYCFTCGAGGDVITFVAKLCGISNMEAAERLNHDFRLGLDIGKKPKYSQILKWKAEERKRADDEDWLCFVYATLIVYRRILWRARRSGPDHAQFTESLRCLETTDYYLDEFQKDKQAFLTPEMRKVVWRVAGRIERIAELRGIA